MSSAPMRCKCSRQAATSLRCSRCSIPICPDCSEVAPVGMLCRQCLFGRKAAASGFEAAPLLRAFAFASPAALLLGWILASLLGIGFMTAIWGGLAHGLATGALVLYGGGRKRGLAMEAVSGICACFGIVGGWYLNAIQQRLVSEPGWSQVYLLNPWSYALLLFSCVVAVMRLRS